MNEEQKRLIQLLMFEVLNEIPASDVVRMVRCVRQAFDEGDDLDTSKPLARLAADLTAQLIENFPS